MGIFKKKMLTATLNLNAKIMPDTRGNLYEDVLEKVLKKKKIGRVDGGGTLLSDDGIIENCDVEIEYKQKEEEALLTIIKMLPMPKGSKLILDCGDRKIALGTLEGLGIYLNGTDLPSEVYASCDVNYVLEKLVEILGDTVVFAGYSKGKTETALFFYGKQFTEMKEKVQSFLQEYPLCEKCRVIQVA